MTQQNRMTVSPDAFMQRQVAKMRGDFGISWKDYQSIYECMNQVMRDVAFEQKVLMIDIDKTVPKTKQFIYDGMHLADEGSILAAHYITDCLQEYFARPRKEVAIEVP